MEKLNPLLQRLTDAEIDFVIVGGFAAVLHGSTFVTRDLDICTIMSDATIDQLRNMISDLNPVHRLSSPRLSFLDTPKAGEITKNLYLQTDLGAIDVLGSIIGVGEFDILKENATVVSIFEKQISVISIEDLIKSKEALGRDKDLLVVKELKAILEKQSL